MSGYTDTERALVDAAKELVREQGLAKTTISQITQRANLNRKTFYKHFQDKYELVNFICYHEWSAKESPFGLEDSWMFVLSMISFFEDDRLFYGAALEDVSQNSFGRYIVENVALIIKQASTKMFTHFGVKKDAIDRISHQLAEGFRQSVMYWLLNQEDKSSVEFFMDIETETNAFAALICEYNRYAGIQCYCEKEGIPHFSADSLGGVRLRNESEIDQALASSHARRPGDISSALGTDKPDIAR